MRLVPFSVTTSTPPSGLNDTCAGPAVVPPGRFWVEPARGTRVIRGRLDAKSRDVRGSAGVDDINEVISRGQTDRHGAARPDGVRQNQLVPRYCKGRNRIATRVNCEKQSMIPAKDERALRAQGVGS